MDEETTDAAWAQQEQLERMQREEEAIKRGRVAAAQLKQLIRESNELYLKSRQAPHNERQ